MVSVVENLGLAAVPRAGRNLRSKSNDQHLSTGPPNSWRKPAQYRYRKALCVHYGYAPVCAKAVWTMLAVGPVTVRVRYYYGITLPYVLQNSEARSRRQ